jgi:hypothetical protein
MNRFSSRSWKLTPSNSVGKSIKVRGSGMCSIPTPVLLQCSDDLFLAVSLPWHVEPPRWSFEALNAYDTSSFLCTNYRVWVRLALGLLHPFLYPNLQILREKLFVFCRHRFKRGRPRQIETHDGPSSDELSNLTAPQILQPIEFESGN